MSHRVESFLALHSDYRRKARDCKGVHMATNPGRDSLETQQLHLTVIRDFVAFVFLAFH
jgi:hypothetical protein